MGPFDILGPDSIREGSATDAYFLRTETTLAEAGINPTVTLEVTADQFPTGEFELFTGVKDAAALLDGLPIDVDALAEGRCFDGGPVMRIQGPYRAVGRYETALLGFLSHASGFATRALEARRAAPDVDLFSFGARHVHPAIAPVVERSALLAGFDGFSHVGAGEILGREASGTMPHALIICFGPGNQEEAWQAFNAAVGPDVPRIALCDTFTDEVDEAVRAAHALGDSLDSIRIDTTASRRGDYRAILQEVRWELDARGYEDIGIFASGGIGLDDLDRLKDVVDGFGIGSHITNADPVDFALDIVELDGSATSKRGKLSGPKSVYRTSDGEHVVKPATAPGPDDGESLLEPLIRDGDIVRSFDLDAATELAIKDAELVD